MISKENYFIHNGLLLNLVKNSKSKANISVKLKNYTTTIIYPELTPIFIIKNIIKKDLKFQENIHKTYYKNPLKINNSLVYIFNTPYKFKIIEAARFKYKIYNGNLDLYGKHSVYELMNKLSNKIFDKYIEKIITDIKNKLFPELKNTQFTIQKRYMTTRWGICKINHNKIRIVLNTLLIHYPVDLIKYVIIHELCHINLPNHSIKFWKYVESKEKKYKILRKELKSFIFK